jgi:hypothetical protein
MAFRLTVLTVAAALAASASPLAQQRGAYAVPRTEHGYPDFQGVWATAFLTMLERPPGVPSLVVPPEHAAGLAEKILGSMPKVIDPDVQWNDIRQLVKVNGEYRTSIIVEPADGRMPFTKAGLALIETLRERHGRSDGPEALPLADRCLENLGYAPMRAVPVFLPRQIVQTRDHVVVMSEDAVGLRVIRLNGHPPPDSIRTVAGYSIGRWERDTLVVETTHFAVDDPARTVIGRPLLLGRKTRVVERFTRVADTELFYQFTVEDPDLYETPWKGEFSLTRHDGPTYEYGCHEGNYSLPNTLRGWKVQAAEKPAPQ